MWRHWEFIGGETWIGNGFEDGHYHWGFCQNFGPCFSSCVFLECALDLGGRHCSVQSGTVMKLSIDGG